jgi:glyoxylase-like metal-dependent hydrolase (beta-lactamase superfamily II)
MKKLNSGTNFARYQLGDLVVIALRDGYVDLPTDRLRKADGSVFGDDLPDQLDLVNGKLRLSVNAFLVIDGDRHILFDTGASNYWDPTMGLLFAAFAEAGIDRATIRTIAFTHTHEDHVNGLLDLDGAPAFPQLETIHVPEREVELLGNYPALMQFQRLVTPLAWGETIGSNITAIQADGHEVGHTAFELSSGGETLLIWGDIIHVPSVQFADPELTWGFDNDPVQARWTRQMTLYRANRPQYYVAGAHLDFPGLGAVVDADTGYAFVPTP